MKYDAELVGKLIKQEREKRGLTQSQLASKLGVVPKQISNYERAKPIPPLDKLMDLCDVFECELGYLLGEENYQNETQIKTAVCNSTGLSMESIQSVLNLATDHFHSDTNKRMMNRLLTSPFLQQFLNDLSDVDRIAEEYAAIDKYLEDKYGEEMLEKVLEVYLSQDIDFRNDDEYQKQHPDMCKALLELDQSIGEQYEKECYTINIARYRLNKTMEAMIDDLYPLSKYHR